MENQDILDVTRSILWCNRNTVALSQTSIPPSTFLPWTGVRRWGLIVVAQRTSTICRRTVALGSLHVQCVLTQFDAVLGRPSGLQLFGHLLVRDLLDRPFERLPQLGRNRP